MKCQLCKIKITAKSNYEFAIAFLKEFNDVSTYRFVVNTEGRKLYAGDIWAISLVSGPGCYIKGELP